MSEDSTSSVNFPAPPVVEVAEEEADEEEEEAVVELVVDVVEEEEEVAAEEEALEPGSRRDRSRSLDREDDRWRRRDRRRGSEDRCPLALAEGDEAEEEEGEGGGVDRGADVGVREEEVGEGTMRLGRSTLIRRHDTEERSRMVEGGLACIRRDPRLRTGTLG